MAAEQLISREPGKSKMDSGSDDSAVQVPASGKTLTSDAWTDVPAAASVAIWGSIKFVTMQPCGVVLSFLHQPIYATPKYHTPSSDTRLRRVILLEAYIYLEGMPVRADGKIIQQEGPTVGNTISLLSVELLTQHGGLRL